MSPPAGTTQDNGSMGRKTSVGSLGETASAEDGGGGVGVRRTGSPIHVPEIEIEEAAH